MPNRILKESICTSDSIDQLSAFEETVFYRLIVNCDDYGRFDGRPKIIASKLFPLKDIRASQIESALRKLTSAELVILYEVGGKPFLQMKTWDRHQQIRAKKSKYPAPESENGTPSIICNQLISDDSKCPRNPIQSESESESESEYSAELNPAPPVAILPLVDGTEYSITENDFQKDCIAFPAVDIKQQYLAMGRWLDSNPKNKKTRNGIRRFINTWLSKEQDRAGRVKQSVPTVKPVYNPFAESVQRGDYDE
jgi:hypothetical protein